MSNAAFLLGAGSSIPAGYPSTAQLTELVKSGRGIQRETDSTYYVDQGASSSIPPTIGLIVAVARRLATEVDRYFFGDATHTPNYEDICYLASQVADSEEGELDNPAIRSFVQDLHAELDPLITASGLPYVSNLREATRECVHFIHDIVWRKPSRAPTKWDHLDAIVNLCQSDAFDRVGIGTLCHDTHLESYLTNRGINFSDGFSTSVNGVRYWDPTQFSDSCSATTLMKLHGSVKWFNFRPDTGDWYSERIGIPDSRDYEHTKTPNGEFQMPLPPRPMFLVGTFNKIARYSELIYLELHYRFRKVLERSDVLAICGYSFGDKGINSAVIDWLYGSNHRRLVVIHPNPDALSACARRAISHKWSSWQETGVLHVVDKAIEDLASDELNSLLVR